MGAELDIPQYEIRLREDLTREQLVDFGRRLVSGSRWMLGDLACTVESRYGEADLAGYAEEIDVGYASLRAYKAVSQAFPAESVSRLTHSWSAYQALAAQPDRLELAAREEPWTMREARELAVSRKPARKPRQPRKTSPGRGQAATASRASEDGAARQEPASEPQDAAGAADPGQQPDAAETQAEGGGPDAQQEPGLAELTAENAALTAENAALRELAAELAGVAAGLCGGWGTCKYCKGSRGLPVHVVAGDFRGDVRACTACVAGKRARFPDASITLRVPAPAARAPAGRTAPDDETGTGPCAYGTDQAGECGKDARPAWLDGTGTKSYLCDRHLGGGWKRRRP